MKDFIKKIYYLLSQNYRPYKGYWIDLLTERFIKDRIGKCVDCVECCKYVYGGQCRHINIRTNRCKIYEIRTCNIWFPVSQKEIDYRRRIQKGFNCKFRFTTKRYQK